MSIVNYLCFSFTYYYRQLVGFIVTYMFYQGVSNTFAMRLYIYFTIKRIKMVHTWLAQSCRHHGPRAVPHPAASQQQSSCLTVNAVLCLDLCFKHYRPAINALIQVRVVFVIFNAHKSQRQLLLAKSTLYNHEHDDTVEWIGAAGGPKASHFELVKCLARKLAKMNMYMSYLVVNTIILTRDLRSISPVGHMSVILTQRSLVITSPTSSGIKEVSLLSLRS